MDTKNEKIATIIKQVSADFLNKESNRTSLMTVTDCHLSDKGRRAKIFFTVLPEDQETPALDFIKRNRTEFQNFLKKNSRIRRVPFIDFEIDRGEKNRQRVEEISSELKE